MLSRTLVLNLVKLTAEFLNHHLLMFVVKDEVLVFSQRDRDLELAARIGQALLKRNHVLSEQNEALEEQLGQAFDQVSFNRIFIALSNWVLCIGEFYFPGCPGNNNNR